ncbi:MAG: four helix bundle protein [Chloroherpetonaceae bacterium]
MERKSAQSFRDLIVWQKAHQLVLDVYALSEHFPKSERYGLTSQLRRAVVSIAANIAEGFKKRGKADKARFFNIAQGSASECEYYLLLVNDLKYAETKNLAETLDEVERLLQAYLNALNHSKT